MVPNHGIGQSCIRYNWGTNGVAETETMQLSGAHKFEPLSHIHIRICIYICIYIYTYVYVYQLWN